MKAGLVSVSFRNLTVNQIIKLAKDNSLEYIEWGGDIHVPMGNVKLARRVRKLTECAGLKCPSYGSYFGTVYKKGQKFPLNFKKVLKTAHALGAKTVRLWPGWPSDVAISEAEERKSVLIVRRLCDLAKKYGISLALECHMLTLTDDYVKTLDYLESINRDNLKMYWQPNPVKSFEYNLNAAKALEKYVVNVHVFNWKNNEKFPLEKNFDEWKQYCDVLKDDSRIFMLEFMPDGDPKSLPNEAKTLFSLLK